MCSNPCGSEVTCFRPESNRGPYGLLNFLCYWSTTTRWSTLKHIHWRTLQHTTTHCNIMPRCILMRAMTHSHDSFICLPRIISMCAKTYSPDSFPNVPWLFKFISTWIADACDCFSSCFVTISSHSWLINLLRVSFEWEGKHHRCSSIIRDSILIFVTPSSHSWLIRVRKQIYKCFSIMI